MKVVSNATIAGFNVRADNIIWHEVQVLRYENSVFCCSNHPPRALNHSNIVKYVGCNLVKKCIIMEYASEGSMQDTSIVYKTWSMEQKLSFARDIVRGVLYMHSCGYVHLDLYARNILV